MNASIYNVYPQPIASVFEDPKLAAHDAFDTTTITTCEWTFEFEKLSTVIG